MKSVSRVLLLVLAVLALCTAAYVSVPALAEGEITVISDSYQNKFPNEILFKLQARGTKEIKNVTLYYTFKSSDANSYARPQFNPGSEISAQYSYDAKKGYIPPGTDVTYYWQLEDAAGNQLKTDPVSFTYEDNRFKWQSVSEGPISVHYYNNQNRAKDLLSGAVQAVKTESSQLRVSYTRPMKIYVYESRSDMADALPKKSVSFDSQIITAGIRVSPDVLLLLGNMSDVKKTLFHEIMHMIVSEAGEGPYAEIPSWLNEGLAMWSEGPMTPEYQRTIDRATKDGTLISVRSLTSYTGDPTQVNLFYGEAWSVVRFMIDTYGLDTMADLLAVFKQGSTMDKALNKVYGFGVDELDARWRTSIGAPSLQQEGSQSRAPQSRDVPTITPFGSQPQGTAPFTDYGLAAVGAAIVVAAVAGLIYRRRRKAP